MTRRFNTCLIWGDYYEATGYTVPDQSKIIIEHSERAGGGYVIPSNLFHDIGSPDDRHKARLTTWLVNQRLQGVIRPKVTTDALAYAQSKRSLPVHERADRLLRFIADSTDALGDRVTVSLQDCDAARAWSESIEWQEVHYLLSYLIDKGWLETEIFAINAFMGLATVDGYSRIAEQRVNVDSSQAFIAMWFDDSMDDSYKNGMEPAIREAGFKPLRIDRKEHINKIDDEIIAEIRRSRFLVADFTHGCDGARGGVYYEAGFAHGLDLPVIFTCRKDSVETLHFDTNHYNHIVWSTPADLREKLKNRILAVIGERPEVNTTS